jgi:hypothetical protein
MFSIIRNKVHQPVVDWESSPPQLISLAFERLKDGSQSLRGSSGEFQRAINMAVMIG